MSPIIVYGLYSLSFFIAFFCNYVMSVILHLFFIIIMIICKSTPTWNNIHATKVRVCIPCNFVVIQHVETVSSSAYTTKKNVYVYIIRFLRKISYLLWQGQGGMSSRELIVLFLKWTVMWKAERNFAQSVLRMNVVTNCGAPCI